MGRTLPDTHSTHIDTHLLRGDLRSDEPMQRHVSWRAGGHAANCYRPVDLDDLAIFLQTWPKHEPIYMIGLGSNLLVREGGVQGAVVLLHARLNELFIAEQDEQGGLIYAGAGVPCPKLARFAALHNLAGVEFLAGIPGTIGGALAMNAGCYGSETWEWVERVKTIDRSGHLSERPAKAYRVGYRQVELRDSASSGLNQAWFAGGWFRLPAGKMETSRQIIKTLLTARITSQPLGLPNAGSVFRNPEGAFAARLIEQCGLKGLRIGDAMVSTQHANFIVNCGQATATDIEALIETVRNRVLARLNIALVTEVRIIGQDKEHQL
ncbi:UDP-N-acetylmuramate dehydrogenase [Nitrosomonas sp. ANs5]|uniref:UDP-N-acetylmuramate dehydrogenase n=1 Tax=Nitrosomonas sp. ANs5 TaxID=3423941 RepID=UPI003D3394EA